MSHGELATSIVVRTFNEEKYLPALLEAIARQSAEGFEVVVVDSGSFDRTVDIARASGATVVELDSRDFTFGYSLNVGIEKARGRNVVLLSAHTLPMADDWLTNLVQPLDAPETAMVFGMQRGGEHSKLSERKDFVRTYGDSRKTLRAPNYFANNANSALRRDLWERQAFDVALPGLEDIAWVKHWMDEGFQVLYEPGAGVYHFHDETWPQIRRRYEREAAAARWIGVSARRRIPGVMVREGIWLAADIGSAARESKPLAALREACLFRYWKLRGTISGLWDASIMDDPRRRERAFFDKDHRAIVIEGPGKASLKRVEVPEVKPGDVLIKVAYEGVCATDLEILDGSLGYFETGLSSYPLVPGHEFSGRVAEVGPNVDDVSAGDEVVAECIQSCGQCEACRRGQFIACARRTEVGVMGRDGGYAEYALVPGRFVHCLPQGTDLRDACLCEPIAVVLKGLARVAPLMKPAAETRCAVVGLGPIGHLCAQVLSLSPGDIVGIDPDEARRQALLHVVPGCRVAAPQDSFEGFELIVEATGNPDVLDSVLATSTAGSVVLLLGLPYAQRSFNFESIVAYDRIVVGTVGSTADDFRAAIEMLPQLDLSALQRHVLPLEQFQEAWRACREKTHLKTILEIDSSLNGETGSPREVGSSRKRSSVERSSELSA